MGFEGLVWVIPVLTAIIVTCLGTLFVLGGWITVASHSSGIPRKSPVALRILSASVAVDVATLSSLWVLRDWDRQFYTMGDMELKRLVLLCGLMVSFLLLLLTAYRMRKDSSPAKGLVTIGTIVLLVVEAVGSSLFLLALIQASPH